MLQEEKEEDVGRTGQPGLLCLPHLIVYAEVPGSRRGWMRAGDEGRPVSSLSLSPPAGIARSPHHSSALHFPTTSILPQTASTYFPHTAIRYPPHLNPQDPLKDLVSLACDPSNQQPGPVRSCQDCVSLYLHMTGVRVSSVQPRMQPKRCKGKPIFLSNAYRADVPLTVPLILVHDLCFLED